MFGIVYKATCLPTGLAYIGQTTKPLAFRKRVHFQEARRGIDRPFYRAIRTYGEDSFRYEVLQDCVPVAELGKTEQAFIAAYDTYHNGYNTNRGGGGRHGRYKTSFVNIADAPRFKADMIRTMQKVDEIPYPNVLNKDEIYDICADCFKHCSLTPRQLWWICQCIYYAPKNAYKAIGFCNDCINMLFPDANDTITIYAEILLYQLTRIYDDEDK